MSTEESRLLHEVITRALQEPDFRRALLADVPSTLLEHGIELPARLVAELEEIRASSVLRGLSAEDLLERLIEDPEFEQDYRRSPAEALDRRGYFVNDLITRQIYALLDSEEFGALRDQYRGAPEETTS